MRSRYSAYTLKNEDYLLNTWHSSTRPSSLNLAYDNTNWKKLKIIFTSTNSVEFVAFFKNADEADSALYEKSIFIKEDIWFYLQGDGLQLMQLTRNKMCPCKSGKKFKRCCDEDL